MGVKLRVEQLCLSFGGVAALIKVSLAVQDGEILADIGPNGAGKTCLLNCISGFYHPQQGRIYFDGRDITHMRSYRRAELGISRTFQNIELYTHLTALDNLMAGRHILMHSGVFDGAIYFGRAAKEDLEHRAAVEEIINFLEMEEIRKTIVGDLPYGLRKRVELGRALALEPKVLLLDEPMAGMNVEEKEDMARFIVDISELRRIPIVLVEHDMGVVMDISDRVVVLDFGKQIAEGPPSEVKINPVVMKAYLGEVA
jgi:branched-chain amino acid transport system ATP-binding protein